MIPLKYFTIPYPTTETVISRWVNGRHRPAAASLRRLARALELPFATVAAAAESAA